MEILKLFKLFRYLLLTLMAIFFIQFIYDQYGQSHISQQYIPSRLLSKPVLTICLPLSSLVHHDRWHLPGPCCPFCPLRQCLNFIQKNFPKTEQSFTLESKNAIRFSKFFRKHQEIALNDNQRLVNLFARISDFQRNRVIFERVMFIHHHTTDLIYMNQLCTVLINIPMSGFIINISRSKFIININQNQSRVYLPYRIYLHVLPELFHATTEFLIDDSLNEIDVRSLIYTRHVWTKKIRKQINSNISAFRIWSMNPCARVCFMNVQSSNLRNLLLFQTDLFAFLNSNLSSSQLYANDFRLNRCHPCSVWTKKSINILISLDNDQRTRFRLLTEYSYKSSLEYTNRSDLKQNVIVYRFFIQENSIAEISLLTETTLLHSFLRAFSLLSITFGFSFLLLPRFWRLLTLKKLTFDSNPTRPKSCVRNRLPYSQKLILNCRSKRTSNLIFYATKLVVIFTLITFFAHQAYQVVWQWSLNQTTTDTKLILEQPLRQFSLNVCFDAYHPLTLPRRQIKSGNTYSEIYVTPKIFNQSHVVLDQFLSLTFYDFNLTLTAFYNKFIHNPRIFYWNGYFCIHLDVHLPYVKPLQQFDHKLIFYVMFAYHITYLHLGEPLTLPPYNAIYSLHLQTKVELLKISTFYSQKTCHQSSRPMNNFLIDNPSPFLQNLNQRLHPLTRSDCIRQDDCLNLCLQQIALIDLKRIPSFVPFVPDVSKNEETVYLTLKADRERLEEACQARFFIPDCERLYFLPTDAIGSQLTDTFRLYPFFNLLHVREVPLIDSTQIILNILNLLCVFGISPNRLMQSIIKLKLSHTCSNLKRNVHKLLTRTLPLLQLGFLAFHLHWLSVNYIRSQPLMQKQVLRSRMLFPPPFSLCFHTNSINRSYLNKKFPKYVQQHYDDQITTGKQIVDKLLRFEELFPQIQILDENLKMQTFSNSKALRHVWQSGKLGMPFKNIFDNSSATVWLKIRLYLQFHMLCYKFKLRFKQSQRTPQEIIKNEFIFRISMIVPNFYIVLDTQPSWIKHDSWSMVSTSTQVRYTQYYKSKHVYQKFFNLNKTLSLKLSGNEKGCLEHQHYWKAIKSLKKSLKIHNISCSLLPVYEKQFNKPVQLGFPLSFYNMFRILNSYKHPWTPCHIDYGLRVRSYYSKANYASDLNKNNFVTENQSTSNFTNSTNNDWLWLELQQDIVDVVYVRTKLIGPKDFFISLSITVFTWTGICISDLLLFLQKLVFYLSRKF